jgi:hypothetical protein
VVLALAGLGAEMLGSVATCWGGQLETSRTRALFLQFDSGRCVFREVLDRELVLDGERSPGRDLWKLDTPAVAEAGTVLGDDVAGCVVLAPVTSSSGQTLGALGIVITSETGAPLTDLPDDVIRSVITTLMGHAPAFAALIELGGMNIGP